MDTCKIGYFTADSFSLKWGSLAIVRDKAQNFYSCILYPDNQAFAESTSNFSKFQIPSIPFIKSRQFGELLDGTFISPISDKEVISASQITVTLLNKNIEQPQWQFVEKQLNSFLKNRNVALIHGTTFTMKLITSEEVEILIEMKSAQSKFFRITPTTKISYVHNDIQKTDVIEYPTFVELANKLTQYINFSINNKTTSKDIPKAKNYLSMWKTPIKPETQDSKEKFNVHPKGILISGSVGSGRSTLIKHCAEKLHFRFIEIDADSFSSTQLTFPEFSKQIPKNTIVLLRNFDAIFSTDDGKSIAYGNTNSYSFQRRVVSYLSNFIDKSDKVFFVMTVISRELVPNSLQSSNRLSFSMTFPPLRKEDVVFILPSTFSPNCIEFAAQNSLSATELINARYANDENELFGSVLSSGTKELRSSKMKSKGSQISSIVPQTNWDDIGGLSETKQIVREAVEWPLTRAQELKEFGIKPPRGILLYGPPGCGKTLIARAIATSLKMSFFSISAASVYQMYLGESERVVRELFALARQRSPSVIFIDEIDAMVGKRGNATGVSERVLSTFLNEMDGVTSLNDVVVVAATNRIDALDEALKRPGRFDCLIEVKPCQCDQDKREILEICTKKMPLHDGALETAMRLIKIGTSGAEIDNICREAALVALNRGLDQISADCFEAVVTMSSF